MVDDQESFTTPAIGPIPAARRAEGTIHYSARRLECAEPMRSNQIRPGELSSPSQTASPALTELTVLVRSTDG
jgi:hypothetical protein